MAMVALGNLESGVRDIDRGLDVWQRTGGNFSRDIQLLEAADILFERGCHEIARRYVDETKRHYATGPERAGYAEYLRLDALLASVEGDRASARAGLREAIVVAEG